MLALNCTLYVPDIDTHFQWLTVMTHQDLQLSRYSPSYKKEYKFQNIYGKNDINGQNQMLFTLL